MLDSSQLVQDVMDGNESPFIAHLVLQQEVSKLLSCMEEIKGSVIHEMANEETLKVKHNGSEYQFERINKENFIVIN